MWFVLVQKYLTIYDDLLNKIEGRIFLPDSILPSENELAADYEASRETIRKALNLLSQNGYIQKIRGKGSLVLDFQKFAFPVSGIQSFSELSKKLKLKSKTYVHPIDSIPRDHDAVNVLKESGEVSIWGVTRIREIFGEKIILDKDYFSEQYVPKLPKEICQGSIYEYLEEELGLVIGFAQKEITVEDLVEEDLEYLDLEGFSNIVVIRSKVYLEDASIFQYTESRHRPDKFRFVDFARRVKN